jgi:hypothetical protein
MQLDKKDYNPELHDKFKGLSVKQPYASLLTRVEYIDDNGERHAQKSIEIRSRNTTYRGDVLVCSSAKPIIPGHQSGVTLGLVELYDVKRVEDFTADDWNATCIPVNLRPKKGWGWMMRNPRPVVEMPVSGQLGFYDVVVPKGDITCFPLAMALGKDGWDIVKNKIKS